MERPGRTAQPIVLALDHMNPKEALKLLQELACTAAQPIIIKVHNVILRALCNPEYQDLLRLIREEKHLLPFFDLKRMEIPSVTAEMIKNFTQDHRDKAAVYVTVNLERFTPELRAALHTAHDTNVKIIGVGKPTSEHASRQEL